MVTMSNDKEGDVRWGRLLITGGMQWATNGRKSRPANQSRDLHEPTILRSLCELKITKVITGPAANYAIVIDLRGNAYMFGRAPATALAANTNGVLSESAPLKWIPVEIGVKPGSKFVDGAAGRSHCLLLDSDGFVWGCGDNVFGQLGLRAGKEEIPDFTRIKGTWGDAKIVRVSVGNTFSLFLTDTGEVYASGSSESGQLGNGKTGERLVKGNKSVFDLQTSPQRVQGLDRNKIVAIASGNQHSLAMDEDGYVWAWGFAGYSRLGLEDTKDRLIPTLVPSFAGREATRASAITCGPTNSVVIDRSQRYWMAGKWKLTGDGSTGQPYTSFKNIQELARCRVTKASCGGCTHFVIGEVDGEKMVAGFGQGVLYGELGLGDTMSSTKPEEITALSGLDVVDVAGGAFFSLFLVQPRESLELARFPDQFLDHPADECLVCNRTDKNQVLLECEKCDEPYHPGCLDPPLEDLPEGEWFCPVCIQEHEEELRDEEELIATARAELDGGNNEDDHDDNGELQSVKMNRSKRSRSGESGASSILRDGANEKRRRSRGR